MKEVECMTRFIKISHLTPFFVPRTRTCLFRFALSKMSNSVRQRGPARKATKANGLPEELSGSSATAVEDGERIVKIDTRQGFVGVTLSNSASPPGVLVDAADPADLACKVGIKQGDVITSIDGNAVTDHAAVVAAIEQATETGAILTVKYLSDPPASMLRSTKSLMFAYLLLFTGGAFGLHHIYLGRDAHAFLHFISFNGLLGLGWVRDLLMLPRYVAAANDDVSHRRQLRADKIVSPERPPRSYSRTLAMLAFAYLFAYVASSLHPRFDEAPYPIIVTILIESLLAAVGASIGVHLIASMPPQAAPIGRILLGAMSTTAVSRFGFGGTGCLMPALGAVLGCRYRATWADRAPQRRLTVGVPRRAAVLVLGATLSGSAVLTALYQRCEVGVVTADGGVQRIRFKDAVNHLVQSPFVQQLGSNVRRLLVDSYSFGWRHAFQNAFDSFDLAGEAHACKVLGLESKCLQSFSAVKRAYRGLALEYHPDVRPAPRGPSPCCAPCTGATPALHRLVAPMQRCHARAPSPCCAPCSTLVPSDRPSRRAAAARRRPPHLCGSQAS